ncbi:3-dehydroquinate synthase [Thermoactinomyces mirandus]|uniref:3-dehydroquinate synthase n=1 Tax=Thermoactinomyces mirandus TaxID=2756294 RepID=A0A7W1XSU4_9BACL|nr:3-dehydroquinate synthase [Thermoactinomyces mirandus]MBA4602551.1 3-dehydroquinate synthase [Thermoactinomyces mirandus]
MKTLTVYVKDQPYPIYIGEGLLEQLPALLREYQIETDRKLMIVTDSNLAPLYGEKLKNRLVRAGYATGFAIMEAGEKSKNLHVFEQLVGECLRFGLDRQSIILALGGGVVGDMAGFLAASYMRGIPFIQLPTTLLAHDSSVGGKVAVNHPLGKNYIGAFHQPLMVVFDVRCLKTLPLRQWRSGMAEVIKHGFIWDESFAKWLDDHRNELFAVDSEAAVEAIYRGCEIKAAVVAQDERETGIRAILNYGHTIGHALEAVSRYQVYTHGEAVSIGMAGAARLSAKVLGTGLDVVHYTEQLLEAFELPVASTRSWSVPAMLDAMKRDKKVKQDKYVFVLAKALGEVKIVSDIPETEIRDVLGELVPN